MKTLKKQFLLIAVLLLSVATFAQKDELKAVGKALAKNDFANALGTLSKLDGMVGSMDEKSKAKYYYYKSKALSGSGKTMEAAKAIKELTTFEQSIGKEKYTVEMAPILQKLVANLREKGSNEYGNQQWKLAKVTLAQIEELSSQDTLYLYYAALSAHQDEDYDLALKYYDKLSKIGFTGVATNYSAVNIETNKREYFPNKNHMDLMMKSKGYKDPKVDVIRSKKGDIVRNAANIHMTRGDNDKALEAISKAREIAPKDVNIILTAADIAYKMKDNAKYLELMNEAIEYKPDDPLIYNNLGIVNRLEGKADEAKASFKKAIEIKPDYKEAIINLADTELSKEDAIVKEMNENLNNFDKWDELKLKQLALYKEVLPLYEKAYGISDVNFDKTNEKEFLRILMNIYENLEMYDKMREVKAKYDEM